MATDPMWAHPYGHGHGQHKIAVTTADRLQHQGGPCAASSTAKPAVVVPSIGSPWGGNIMMFTLGFVGVLAWLFAAFALFVGFTTGTDIQLIAAAVWGTFGAVCLGSFAVMGEVRELREAMTKPPANTIEGTQEFDG
jgi:hypothetical protein